MSTPDLTRDTATDAPDSATAVTRDESYGQHGLTFVDRAGVWMSGHQIRRTAGTLDGKDVGDFGCGFEATFMRSVLTRAQIGDADRRRTG